MSVIGQVARQALRPLLWTFAVTALYAGIAVGIASFDKVGPSKAMASDSMSTAR